MKQVLVFLLFCNETNCIVFLSLKSTLSRSVSRGQNQTNTIRWTNVDLVLAHRLRLWANVIRHLATQQAQNKTSTQYPLNCDPLSTTLAPHWCNNGSMPCAGLFYTQNINLTIWTHRGVQGVAAEFSNERSSYSDRDLSPPAVNSPLIYLSPLHRNGEQHKRMSI